MVSVTQKCKANFTLPSIRYSGKSQDLFGAWRVSGVEVECFSLWRCAESLSFSPLGAIFQTIKKKIQENRKPVWCLCESRWAWFLITALIPRFPGSHKGLIWPKSLPQPAFISPILSNPPRARPQLLGESGGKPHKAAAQLEAANAPVPWWNRPVWGARSRRGDAAPSASALRESLWEHAGSQTNQTFSACSTPEKQTALCSTSCVSNTVN